MIQTLKQTFKYWTSSEKADKSGFAQGLCFCKLFWIFLLGSMLLGGMVEYLCSFVQEVSFGTLSWEYSGTFMNLNGRTNLMFAFFWGALGLLWMQVFYPLLLSGFPKRPASA